MYYGLQQAEKMLPPGGVDTPHLTWFGVPGSASTIDLSPSVVALSDLPNGWRIVAKETAFGSEAVDLGQGNSLSDVLVTNRIRDAWNITFGVRPNGANLANLLHQHMDQFADDAGQTQCRPIRAEGRTQRIWLEGRIASEVVIDPSGNALQKSAFQREVKRAQRDLNDIRDQSQRGDMPADLHLKMISAIADKLGVKADDIKPANWRADERPKRPQTTATDDFSGNLSNWTSIYNGTAPTWSISGGKLQATVVWDGIKLFRHNTAMSANDNWSQATFYEVNGSGHNAAYIGPFCRYGSSGKACYGSMANYNGDQSMSFYLVRIGTTGSVAAYLDGPISGYTYTYSPTIGYTPLLESKAASTSISHVVTGGAGIARRTVTDGNITTGTYCGIFAPGDQNLSNVPKFSLFTGTDGVTSPPVVTSNSDSGTYGSAFSYSITATNTPTSYGASGLPTGLSLNSSTGAITGTPTQSGTFTVNLSATNAGGTGTGTLTLTITGGPPGGWHPAHLRIGPVL